MLAAAGYFKYQSLSGNTRLNTSRIGSRLRATCA
jgi:hypothetical protein